MRTRLTVVAVTLVGLMGCSGSEPTSAPSPKTLAEQIGCTDYRAATGQIELGAREEASCSLGEDRLTILTYASNGPRDSAQSIADQFGGIAIVGDRFVVRTDTQSTAERVQGAVGGTIR